MTFWFLFLSTPSARRATAYTVDEAKAIVISIHALREEGDHRHTPRCFVHKVISIHALREEGDRTFLAFCVASCYFYPRPPRGGRRWRTIWDYLPKLFLSTPSARRATPVFPEQAVRHEISIHALREEGDLLRLQQVIYNKHFYPRPPRGGRRTRIHHGTRSSTFLSTPSARRAT